MEQQTHIDSFALLEEKVENLIQHITSLRSEKEELQRKIQENERIINDLNMEMGSLREVKTKAKDRIDSILEKIDKLNI